MKIGLRWMKFTGLNIKMLLAMGAIVSFIALTYAVVHYFEMRSMELLVKGQDYGDDIVVDKLEQIGINKTSEIAIFLSEIRNRGKQLSLLRKGMIKTVSRAKLFAEVEFVLWLISASVFSILLIREEKGAPLIKRKDG